VKESRQLSALSRQKSAGLLGRQRLLKASQCILLILVLPIISRAADTGCPVNGSDESKITVNGYTVRTMRSEFFGCVEVSKNGAVVYREADDLRYFIGNDIQGEGKVPSIKPGTNITGGRDPQVLIGSWSGGAHCCFKFRLLELGSKFRKLAELDAADGDYAHFEDLDKDGKYEFVGNDCTFAYWETSFAESPAPKVILRPTTDKEGRVEYRLATDLMQRPAPPPEETRKLVAKIKSNDEWSDGVPSALWSAILDFIYSGHPDLAWQIWNETWPESKPAKGGFLGAFCDRLTQSPYFFELTKTINSAPPDCFSISRGAATEK